MDPIILKAAADVVTHFINSRIDAPANTSKTTPTIERHLLEALNWSRRIQFYGMARAEETDTATIPLHLSAEPRRFRGRETSARRSENDLLADNRHYVLLGDPGAGKTTTLKRIVQKLLLEPPADDADTFAFPIVFRLREMDTETFPEAFAIALGLPYERLDKDERHRKAGLWIGDTPLRNAVADLLNESCAVLILDGLDEAPAEKAEALKRDLHWLALNTSTAKIVVSCRTGDYSAMIEGFDLMEICPLEPAEVYAISSAWLGDPQSFLDELRRVPYGDVADRPLLLTQLLFLYKRYGYLPDQPSQVYRKVISLLLQEWDAERGISRRSRYARFDADRKAAFLSGIAYHLTYKTQKKVFAESDLIEAYRAIHERFQLPTSEIRQVIAEIETHTGIISVAGHNLYEFSHLSLQEYLCADYLVRESHSEHLNDYLRVYPAPVAIAVALSSNPSAAFAGLFLKGHSPSAAAVGSLLSRLILEQPFFDKSAALGAVILKLYRLLSARELRGNLDRFVRALAVKDSIAAALQFYHPTPREPGAPRDLVTLVLHKQLPDARGFKAPDAVSLPIDLLRELYADGQAAAAALMSELRQSHISFEDA